MSDNTSDYAQEPIEMAEDWDLVSYEQANEGFLAVPEGNWQFRVTFIEKPQLKTAKYNKTGDQKQSRITFEVVNTDETDDEGRPIEGRTLRQYFTLSLNAKSALYKLVAKPILGEEFDTGRIYKPSDFINGEFMGTVALGEPKGEAGIRYSKIVASFPVRKSRKTRTSKAEQPEVAEPHF
jgi:hypothetical protein